MKKLPYFKLTVNKGTRRLGSKEGNPQEAHDTTGSPTGAVAKKSNSKRKNQNDRISGARGNWIRGECRASQTSRGPRGRRRKKSPRSRRMGEKKSEAITGGNSEAVGRPGNHRNVLVRRDLKKKSGASFGPCLGQHRNTVCKKVRRDPSSGGLRSAL